MATVERMPPGTVRLNDASSHPSGTKHVYTASTGSLVLQPKPTDDPDDPLNWATWRKWLNYGVVLVYVLFTFTLLDIAAVAYSQLVDELGMTYQISTIATALNFTGLAIGCVAFIPLTYRYGRRPIYLLSVTVQLVSAVWAGSVKSTNEYMAVNLVMGLGGAISETIVQITIADLFFVHQYATVNGIFLFMQGTGAFLGPVAAGFIVAAQGWRWMWFWNAIFLGVTLVVVVFVFEEATFIPSSADEAMANPPASSEEGFDGAADTQSKGQKGLDPLEMSRTTSLASRPVLTARSRKPLRSRLALVTKTDAPIKHHYITPFILLFQFPAVAYTAVTFGAVLAWFSVLISISSTRMVDPPYNFSPSDIGLLNLWPFVGQLIGALGAGPVSDRWIQALAKRNGGIYEPEMRLWLALFPAPLLVTGGILMFGIGIANEAPWVLLAMGIAVFACGFSVCLDVALAYLTDSYQNVSLHSHLQSLKPDLAKLTRVIGDALVGVVFIRNAISVIVLFCLSPWRDAVGMQNLFVMVGIISFLFCMVPIPLLIWGKRARVATADKYRYYSGRQPGHRPV
ncbi:Major facilitator superfamily transporter [Tolypocladium paradoxum]|uniref:Major facilitator superfamily transporter n=1 Tax=Tolypocladium paradoxum TaxID=94208 RepID=A0A2S4KSE1_9HYPO|nr:Major facilitator superfamily transporter [Tolypocladium paradoxum]